MSKALGRSDHFVNDLLESLRNESFATLALKLNSKIFPLSKAFIGGQHELCMPAAEGTGSCRLDGDATGPSLEFAQQFLGFTD